MKEHFKEYNELESRIKELSAKLEEINLSLYTVGSVPFDRIPSEPSNHDITLIKISEKNDIEKEILDLKNKKQDLYLKHLKEIAQVDCEIYRSVLRCWYLLKMSIAQIEKLTGYNKSHIYRIKKEAEDAFSEKLRRNETK